MESVRHERGLTREQLAALAGLTSRTIFGIERQGVRPQRATLYVLAEALGCDVAHLNDEGPVPSDRSPVTTSPGAQAQHVAQV